MDIPLKDVICQDAGGVFDSTGLLDQLDINILTYSCSIQLEQKWKILIGLVISSNKTPQ